jgi:hypothetical protein
MNSCFNLILLVAFTSASACNSGSRAVKDEVMHQLWLDCKADKVLSYEVFNIAVKGYRNIEAIKKKNVITIIDFSKPSTEKRFFVIDIKNKQILFNCLVAHGKNSGENTADVFSNDLGSLKSSLGFFLTAETYIGDHGYSLKLDGLEKGINDKAREREIVIHGADYVSEKFIKENNRLGRSWGCPALPSELSKQIIDIISEGSCLFIYSPDEYYQKNSEFI